MNPVRVGIVGLGRIAEAHYDGYSKISDLAVIQAVSDVRESVLEQRRAAWGAKSAYLDYREMLADPEVQLVDVCLPHHLHLQVVTEALERGKHVLVEKPIASTLEEADRMINLARERGVRLMVAHNHIFNPVVARAKELLDAGAIGRPHLAKAYSMGWFLFTPDDFRKSKEMTGGGVFIDTGAHFIYVMEHLMGPIRSVGGLQANLARKEMEGDDNAIAVVTFESGAIGEITTSYAGRIPKWRDGFPAGWDQTVHIYGDAGAIRFSLPGEKLWFYSDADGHEDWVEEDFTGSYAASFVQEIDAFVRALASGTEPPVTGEDGRRTLQVILQAYKAMDEGRTVTIERG